VHPHVYPPLYADPVAEADYSPSPRTRKVLAQLKAEIAASGQTTKSLAISIGKPYSTFRRYIAGERAIPADDLLDALDGLGVDYATFMRRVGER
jgi:hypothetical protein